jgi:hypothetical protein
MYKSTGALVKKYTKYGVTRHLLVKWCEKQKLTWYLTEGRHLKIDEDSLRSLLKIAGEVE